jgi:hypothetical protein
MMRICPKRNWADPVQTPELKPVPLLHPASFEKPGIGGVLLDVGGVALFRRILNVLVPSGSILVDLGFVSRPFMAAVGGWHGRHFIVASHG